MSQLFEDLVAHAGHTVEIATYGDEGVGILNVAVECMDCSTVLVDEDAPS